MRLYLSPVRSAEVAAMAEFISYLTVSLVMVMVVLVYMAGRLPGMQFMHGYMVVPLLLCTTHAAGELMQTHRLGPVWLQDHMHNVGVGAFMVSTVSFAFALSATHYHRKVYLVVVGIPVVTTLMMVGW